MPDRRSRLPYVVPLWMTALSLVLALTTGATPFNLSFITLCFLGVLALIAREWRPRPRQKARPISPPPAAVREAYADMQRAEWWAEQGFMHTAALVAEFPGQSAPKPPGPSNMLAVQRNRFYALEAAHSRGNLMVGGTGRYLHVSNASGKSIIVMVAGRRYTVPGQGSKNGRDAHSLNRRIGDAHGSGSRVVLLRRYADHASCPRGS